MIKKKNGWKKMKLNEIRRMDELFAMGYKSLTLTLDVNKALTVPVNYSCNIPRSLQLQRLSFG